MPEHDVLIIGAGPGGYVAAIRAAQLGFDVGVVEREAALGGTCVRIGCIPSKALLESSARYFEAKEELGAHGVRTGGVELDLATLQERKDAVVKANTDGVAFLFDKNGVTRYQGDGRLADAHTVTVAGADGDTTVHAEHVVIATGSSPTTLPGVEIDGERVVDSEGALAFDEVPERLAVIGAGYIGLELGSVWSRLGSEVTVVEYLDRTLPGMDAEIAREAQKAFTRQGLTFRLGSKVTGVKATRKGATVEIEDGEPVKVDRVLVAVGRRPHTDGLGLDDLGVDTDESGRIRVDTGFATSVAGVYAIGDVIPGPMLAHKAEEDGVALVERLATGVGHVDYGLVPGIVYTEPEVATVGASEEDLKEAGTPYRKGVFPYRANGRARALGHTGGKVKMLAHAETDRLLGVHIIGARAGDLIAEAVAALTFGASSEDMARTVHAHPTLSEIVKEAALDVDGRAVHS